MTDKIAIIGFGNIASAIVTPLLDNKLIQPEHVFQHTSASILVQENADPEVRTDLTNYFGRLVPPANDPTMHYLTHRYEGDDDMPAHIKAAMLPVSIQIPVIEGRLALGTWQGIYLFEHRDAPHHRRVIATLG